MRRSLFVAGAALAAAVGTTVPLEAQGSSVDQHSACMSGRIGAGVADPCQDGSAIYFSPAALAMQPSMLGVNVTFVRSENEFVYDREAALSASRGPETTPVPAAFGSYRINDRLAAGLGVFAPYGLGLDWNDDLETFEGRFTSYDTQLQGIYIQPTVAYQLVPGRVSIGGGIDVVRASLELNQRVDLATTPLPTQPIPGQTLTFGNLGIPFGTDFADATLTGDGTGVTGHVGFTARLSDKVSFGARYLHRATVEFEEGDAEFTVIPTGLTLPAANPLGAPAGTPLDALLAPQFAGEGALAPQSVSTELTFPAQAVIGISVRPVPDLNLLADYQWTSWSDFDALPVDFGGGAPDRELELGYDNTSTLRFGAELAATEALMLRAGFRYNEAATPIATPLLPENERNYYTAGLGYRFGRRLGIDVMYQFIDQADRRGRVRPVGGPVGLYTAEASTFGVTLSYRFGSMMER